MADAKHIDALETEGLTLEQRLMAKSRSAKISDTEPDIRWNRYPDKPIAPGAEFWFYFYGYGEVCRRTMSAEELEDFGYEISHWCDAPADSDIQYMLHTGHYAWRNGQ